jgi:glycosyltransferase involved in cell wall biosynthesis
MKILYLGNLLQHKGLSPTTIDSLSVKLKELGYTVKVFSRKDNMLLRMFDMLKGIWNNKDTSIVLIDTYSTKAFIYAVLCSLFCQILKIKYIPYLHGGNLPNRLKVNPKICRLIFSNSFMNVAPSAYLENVFLANGYSNTILIPNTIEIQNYSFLERDVRVPKILWVRAFAEIYNPKLAVDVLVNLKKTFPEAELCMVGPDKDESLSITQQYANEKDVKVIFTGKLSKKEWVNLSKNYNIFLNTTNFDNTPVSVMEAMALGLAVVSTNVGGLPFLINDKVDGILAESNNSLALSGAIQNLMSDLALYKNIIFNARKKAQSWDWSEVKTKWISLFNSLED